MKINLLPPPPPILRIRIAIFTLIMASMLAVSAYSMVIWYEARFSIANQAQLVSDQNNALSLLQIQWGKLQSEQTNLKLVQQMHAIQSSSGRGSVALIDIFRDLPGNTILQQLTYNAGFVSLQTTFPSLTEAANTIAVFQHDTSFSSVTVTTVVSNGMVPAGSTSPATVTTTSKTNAVLRKVETMLGISKTAQASVSSASASSSPTGSGGVTVTFSITLTKSQGGQGGA